MSPIRILYHELGGVGPGLKWPRAIPGAHPRRSRPPRPPRRPIDCGLRRHKPGVCRQPEWRGDCDPKPPDPQWIHSAFLRGHQSLLGSSKARQIQCLLPRTVYGIVGDGLGLEKKGRCESGCGGVGAEKGGGHVSAADNFRDRNLATQKKHNQNGGSMYVYFQ